MIARETYRWGIMLAVLSLDVVAPFTPAMGLPDTRGYLTSGLRTRIVANRSDAAARAIPDNEALVRAVTADLSALAPGLGDAFAGWMRDVATVGASDRKAWLPWMVVWQDWALGPPPAELREQGWFRSIVETYHQTMDARALDGATRAARGAPSSEWDIEMYGRHRYYDSDDGEDQDPFIPVRSTIEFLRFRHFVRTVVPALQGPQLDALDAAAAVRMAALGLDAAGPFRGFAAMLHAQ